MQTVTIENENTGIGALHANGKKAAAKLPLVFIVCFFSTLCSGIVSMLMSVYLPDVVRDLLGNVSADKMNNVSAWINALFIFGWMFGGIAWGFICDRIGRAKSVAFSTLCYGVFATLTAIAPSWFLVSVCRFFSGFGIGGVLVTTTILITELWSAKRKTVILGFGSLAMPVGFFVAGAINNFVSEWRTAFWVGLIPVCLAVIAFIAVPESAKWKTEKYSLSKKPVGNTQLFAAANRKHLLSGSLVFGAMLIGLWAIFSWSPTWVQSISTNDPQVQQLRGNTMMILAGGGIAGSFFSGWIVNSIGLRKTMLMCFAVCFILAFVVFKLNTTITVATFAEMALLVFFFGISQGALGAYIPALFPTGICASATGFCFNVGRLFTGTVVFFIGALVSLLGGYGDAMFIFSFVFVLGFVATWFTKDVKQISAVT